MLRNHSVAAASSGCRSDGEDTVSLVAPAAAAAQIATAVTAHGWNPATIITGQEKLQQHELESVPSDTATYSSHACVVN